MTDRFVTLLRHGEVQGGARFRGGHNDALSDIGWAQMRAVAAREAQGSVDPQHRWDRILSSPARRCAEFARRLAEERGLPLSLSRDFAERRFGAWEGLAAHQIPPVELERFWDDPAVYTPPGAEHFVDFRDRVLAGWAALQDDPAPHTLVVTHGGAIRVIAAAVLGLTDPSGILIEVPPACVTCLRLPRSPGQPSLMAHGERAG